LDVLFILFLLGLNTLLLIKPASTQKAMVFCFCFCQKKLRSHGQPELQPSKATRVFHVYDILSIDDTFL
jgi:hypothetical protein